MNASLLIRRLESAGVILIVKDTNLSVDAPAETLTDDDRTALVESKADIISVLERRQRKLQAASEYGFIAAYSKEQGYITLHDPLTGGWHDFPASSCLPSVVEEAKARARKRREGRSA